jgi:hypothetical protein
MVVVSPPESQLRSDEAKQSFMSVNEAPLEAFATPFWAWALGQDGWLELLNEKREQGVDLRVYSDQPVPDRIANNLAIIQFGWAVFEKYASHLGIEPASLVDGGVEDAVESALLEVMPKGKSENNFDDLMHLIASMVANERLRRGVHFAIRDERSIVLPLQQVLPEAERYARETNRREALLGEDAYKKMAKEMAGRHDSYVKDVSAVADFEPQGGRQRSQRHGILIDVVALEEKRGIDAGVWLGTHDREVAGPGTETWMGIPFDEALN